MFYFGLGVGVACLDRCVGCCEGIFDFFWLLVLEAENWWRAGPKVVPRSSSTLLLTCKLG